MHTYSVSAMVFDWWNVSSAFDWFLQLQAVHVLCGSEPSSQSPVGIYGCS